MPAADPVRCFALSLYGPHAVGTDLNSNERTMLSRLARFAAAMYAELEAVELRQRITYSNGSSRRRASASDSPQIKVPRMSALGHQRTSTSELGMSAFRGETRRRDAIV